MFIPIWLLIVIAIILTLAISSIISNKEYEKRQLLKQHTVHVRSEDYHVLISWTSLYGTSLAPAEEAELWLKMLNLAKYNTANHVEFDWKNFNNLAQKVGKTNVIVLPLKF